ncbi:MAG: Terminase-like family protein [Methanosaeta sp. PtaU1.Bin028]|nr:MAG: Terminase-like family protein [Methanosaeta sp. PtaU1.Bin028]
MSSSERQRVANQLEQALAEKRRRKHAVSPSAWATDLCLIRDKDDTPVRPDPWQVEMLESRSTRICLNIHRQGGKSAMSSLICLHTALFRKKSLSLIIAPSLRQSQENFKKIQDYLDLLPSRPAFHEHTKLSLQFENGSRILCLPGGNEGRTIRGFSRPDVIVEDEAAQCSEELFDAILPMMTTHPLCKFILCSTPFGQRGHFHKIWNDSTNGWEKHQLRARDNPRISQEFLAEMKEFRGPYVFAQEYDCEFVASETQLISHENILKALNSEIPIIEI